LTLIARNRSHLNQLPRERSNRPSELFAKTAAVHMRSGHTMTVMLNTLDQVPGIGTIEGPQLTFEARAVSAREIVRARVAAEVERHNSADDPPRLVGWATPAEPERTLNEPRRERRRPLDTERQIDVALEALRKRLVILLFNGVQVEDIDAPLMLTPVSEAYFLRLVPLAGG
jgi:predicted small metal-binding protein